MAPWAKKAIGLLLVASSVGAKPPMPPYMAPNGVSSSYVNTQISAVSTNVAPGGTEGTRFGDEYLYYVRKMWDLWRRGLGPLPFWAMMGDSNAEGDGVTNPIYKPHYGLKNALRAQGVDANIQLYAVPGSNMKQLVQDTLPGVLALNPDVVQIRSLINDQGSDRDSAEYWTRQALTMIRAGGKSVDFRTCIIQMPSATPDSVWFLSVEKWLRPMSREFQCMLVDTWTLWRDNLHSDSSWTPDRFHPTDMLSAAITGNFAEAVVLRGQMIAENSFLNNRDEAPIADVNDINSWYWPVYPPGLSGYRVTLPSAAQYPFGGAVITYRHPDTTIMQTLISRDENKVAWRLGGPSGFRGFMYPIATDSIGRVIDANPSNDALKFYQDVLFESLNGVSIQGATGQPAGLFLSPDHGNSNAKLWAHYVETSGIYKIKNYFTGAFRDVLAIDPSTMNTTWGGTIDAPAYKSGGTAGVDCSGGSSITITAVKKGIITGCTVNP